MPSVTWDSAFETSPADTDEAKYGATKIRQLKVAISERLELELDFKAGIQPLLKAGKAAVIYLGTTAEINALTGMSTGAYAWDTTLKVLKRYSGAAWVILDIAHSYLSGLIDLGSEKVTNGGFDSDTGWTKGTGWSIGSGVATKAPGSASDLEQNVSAVATKTYKVVFTLVRNAGSLTPAIGGTNGTTRSASGTYSENITTADTSNLKFQGDASFDGNIDNVSVKEVLGTDDHPQYLHLDKAGQTLNQSLAVAAGKTIDGRDISADGALLDAQYKVRSFISVWKTLFGDGDQCNTGSISVTFSNAAKTITRTSGSFITDRFILGQVIYTTSALNPGPFTIAAITALVLTLTTAPVNETVTCIITGYDGGDKTFTTTTTLPGGYDDYNFMRWNNLTINAGVVISFPASQRCLIVLVKDTLTLNGEIRATLRGGAGGTAIGAAGGAGCWGGGGGGGDSTNYGGSGGGGGCPGQSGGSTTPTYGGGSFLGSAPILPFSLGLSRGGNGALGTGVTASKYYKTSLSTIMFEMVRYMYGAGGAGGMAGGDGGDGGGVLWIEAKNIVWGAAGKLAANAGSGATGGGGGGGGGTIVLAFRTKSGTATFEVAKGVSTGGGGSGVDGAYYEIEVAQNA